MEFILSNQQDIAEAFADLDQLLINSNTADLKDKGRLVEEMENKLDDIKSMLESMRISLSARDNGQAQQARGVISSIEVKIREYEGMVKRASEGYKKSSLFAGRKKPGRGLDGAQDDELFVPADIPTSNVTRSLQASKDKMAGAKVMLLQAEEQAHANASTLEEQGLKLELIQAKVHEVGAEEERGRREISDMFRRHRRSCLFGIGLAGVVVVFLVIFLCVKFVPRKEEASA